MGIFKKITAKLGFGKVNPRADALPKNDFAKANAKFKKGKDTKAPKRSRQG